MSTLLHIELIKEHQLMILAQRIVKVHYTACDCP